MVEQRETGRNTMSEFLLSVLMLQYAAGWLCYVYELQDIESRSKLITMTVVLVLGGAIGGIMYTTYRNFKKAWNNK